VADEPWLKYQSNTPSAGPGDGPWAKYQAAKPDTPAAPKDDLPWDVPMSGAQMRAQQTKTAEADKTLDAASPAPGFMHMLASPFIAAAKYGQAMLGERAPLAPTEMLGAAAFGAEPFGGGVGTASTMAGDLGAAGKWAAERGTPHPWTPEMVEQAAKDLGAPTVAKAQKVIEGRINKVSPTTAQTAIDSLNAAREAGDPMMLPDVLRPAEALAGRVARAPGEYGDILPEAFQARNAEAVKRLTGGINEAFGEEGAYDASQALMSARKAAAKPAYDTAYAQPPVNPDVMKPDGAIGALMDRPSVKAGMANARKIAAEEGVDMNTLGIDLDAQGEPVLTRVPTWQTLDYMKRGIDNVVEQYRDKTTGKLMLDTYGRAADITRGEFVGTLRDLNGAYGKALDTWGGPSRSLDAIEVGRDALTRSPEMNAARVAEMTEDQKEFARLGIAQQLRDIANKRGPLAAEFDRVAGTRYGSSSTRDQLRPFFKDEAAYKKFVDSVSRQVTMARTPNKVLGGSQTAGRVAEDTSPITLGEAIHGGTALALGHPMGIVRAATNLGMKLWDQRDPALNAEIARVLGNTENTLARDAKGRLVIVKPPETPPP
jgi:hypothetical protein